MRILTLKRLGFLKVVFPGGGSNGPPLNNLFRVGWKQQNADTISYMLTPLVSLQQGNVRKSETSMKIVNTERENFHFF